MKYAIISDIHANLEALNAVLKEIDSIGVDKIICLGDLVGYYADPNECVNIIRDRKIKCIAGNHDRVATGLKKPDRFGQNGKKAIYWTKKNLKSNNVEFLKALPLYEIIDDNFLIVHGALHPVPNEDNYLLIETEIQKTFDMLISTYPHINICFFGHTHLSCVYENNDGILSMTKSYTVPINLSMKYLINPGSVGKSHHHNDQRASFLVYDLTERTIVFYRKYFDIDQSHKKAEESGMIYAESVLRKSARQIFRFGKRIVS